MDKYSKIDEEEDKKESKPTQSPEPEENEQFEARKRAFKSIRNAFGRP